MGSVDTKPFRVSGALVRLKPARITWVEGIACAAALRGFLEGRPLLGLRRVTVVWKTRSMSRAHLLGGAMFIFGTNAAERGSVGPSGAPVPAEPKPFFASGALVQLKLNRIAWVGSIICAWAIFIFGTNTA